MVYERQGSFAQFVPPGRATFREQKFVGVFTSRQLHDPDLYLRAPLHAKHAALSPDGDGYLLGVLLEHLGAFEGGHVARCVGIEA